MGGFNLTEVLPTMGTAGGLLVIIAVLTRLWLTSESRYSREITRVNTDHDAELAELRDALKQCRGYTDQLQGRLDAERERRRTAEDRTGAHRDLP